MTFDKTFRTCNEAMSRLFSFRIKCFRDYVYISIPRTGSSTVIDICGYVPWRGHWRHESAQRIIERIGSQSWEKKFTFTFVRNPYARVVSEYFTFGPGTVCDSKTHFRHWARCFFSAELYPYKNLLRNRWNQVQYITNNEGKILVDFVGKLENIEEDMRVVCERLNIPFSYVPHLNKARVSHDYREYYNDKTREVVGNWFREDLEQFGYDFDGLETPPPPPPPSP